MGLLLLACLAMRLVLPLKRIEENPRGLVNRGRLGGFDDGVSASVVAVAYGLVNGWVILHLLDFFGC